MTFWPEVPYPTFSLLSYPNDHLYKSRSKKSVYPASHLSHEYVTVPEKITSYNNVMKKHFQSFFCLFLDDKQSSLNPGFVVVVVLLLPFPLFH